MDACCKPLGRAGQGRAAQRAEQVVACAGIDVQFPAARGLPDRDVDAGTCAFVPGIGQDRQVLQGGPQDREQVLAGGGNVMDPTGQHVRDPQRDAARGEQRLDAPAEGMRLAGIPAVYFLAFLAGGLFLQPVGCDDLAVQDQVRQLLLSGRIQGLGQAGSPGGEDLDDLIDVPVGGGCDSPKPLPSRGISGRSRNQASANTACFQQVRARVPRRVPSSRRCPASRTER